VGSARAKQGALKPRSWVAVFLAFCAFSVGVTFLAGLLLGGYGWFMDETPGQIPAVNQASCGGCVRRQSIELPATYTLASPLFSPPQVVIPPGSTAVFRVVQVVAEGEDIRENGSEYFAQLDVGEGHLIGPFGSADYGYSEGKYSGATAQVQNFIINSTTMKTWVVTLTVPADARPASYAHNWGVLTIGYLPYSQGAPLLQPVTYLTSIALALAALACSIPTASSVRGRMRVPGALLPASFLATAFLFGILLSGLRFIVDTSLGTLAAAALLFVAMLSSVGMAAALGPGDPRWLLGRAIMLLSLWSVIGLTLDLALDPFLFGIPFIPLAAEFLVFVRALKGPSRPNQKEAPPSSSV